MAKELRLHSVNSDGTPSGEEIIPHALTDPDTGKPYKGDDGQPSVVVYLRPITKEKYRSVVRRHTERVPNRKTRQMEEVTDWEAVQDELIQYAVSHWKGINGADGKPLVCIDATKLALDGELTNELVSRAHRGEGVETAEAAEAGFREPARISHLVR